jgi:hypothetical protein
MVTVEYRDGFAFLLCLDERQKGKLSLAFVLETCENISGFLQANGKQDALKHDIKGGWSANKTLKFSCVFTRTTSVNATDYGKNINTHRATKVIAL